MRTLKDEWLDLILRFRANGVNIGISHSKSNAFK